jgi:lysophospholipase L1-like esterase
VEFLEARIDSIYRLYPADIVLLHAGHNHFADQLPVDGMIRAYGNIVRQIWAVNPEALVLIAQVTPSGKLPKYSYIPELNQRIAQMVKATDDQRLILVDMASGHDWQRMTIHDKVHPNAVGAQHMARRWMEAIKKVWKPCQKKNMR